MIIESWESGPRIGTMTALFWYFSVNSVTSLPDCCHINNLCHWPTQLSSELLERSGAFRRYYWELVENYFTICGEVGCSCLDCAQTRWVRDLFLVCDFPFLRLSTGNILSRCSMHMGKFPTACCALSIRLRHLEFERWGFPLLALNHGQEILQPASYYHVTLWWVTPSCNLPGSVLSLTKPTERLYCKSGRTKIPITITKLMCSKINSLASFYHGYETTMGFLWQNQDLTF